MQVFSGFNLTITKDFFGNDFGKLCTYAECYKNNNALAEEKIRKIIRSESISASQISDEWFPQVKVDVFISHSSKDKELAYALAGWLYKTFGLVSFIDSIFWDYAGNLLDDINYDFSRIQPQPDDGILYNYKKCCKASEHVNILLNAALHKLIDKTEAVFFLNTENSIQIFIDADEEISTTYSPWIFSEILCTQLVRKKPLCDYRSYKLISPIFEQAAGDIHIEKRDLNLSYEVSLSHLDELSEDTLYKWQYMDKSKFYGYPLDGLYYLSKNYRKELQDTREFFARKYKVYPSDFLFR